MKFERNPLYILILIIIVVLVACSGTEDESTSSVDDEFPEATLGATFACPWDQSDPTLHTFIVAGQSGMVARYGQRGTLPDVYETGIDQLQMWDEGSWKRLGLGLGNGNVVPRYGPELAFAWTMHAACPDANIGIIKYAVGGTSIDTWVLGGENGAELHDRVLAAFQAHSDITLEGFLFKQGAGDMHNRTQAESWGEKYLSIVVFYRSAAIVPNDLPFIHGTVRSGDFPDDISGIDPDSILSPSAGRPFAVHVTLEQWMVQYERPGIYPTIMRDIPIGEDGTHATPEGIRLEGRNFAETYANEMFRRNEVLRSLAE